MFCKVCGNWIKESEEVCSTCGAVNAFIEGSEEFEWDIKDFPVPQEPNEYEIDWQSGTIKDLKSGYVYSQEKNLWMDEAECQALIEEMEREHQGRDVVEEKSPEYDQAFVWSSNEDKAAAARPVRPLPKHSEITSLDGDLSDLLGINESAEDEDTVTRELRAGASGASEEQKQHSRTEAHAEIKEETGKMEPEAHVSAAAGEETFEGSADEPDATDMPQWPEEMAEDVAEDGKTAEPEEEGQDYRIVTMYETADGRSAMSIMSKEEEEAIEARKKAEMEERLQELQKEQEATIKAARERKIRTGDTVVHLQQVSEDNKKQSEEKYSSAQEAFGEMLDKEVAFKAALDKLGETDFIHEQIKKQTEEIHVVKPEDDPEAILAEFDRRAQESGNRFFGDNPDIPEDFKSIAEAASERVDLSRTDDIKFNTIDIQSFFSDPDFAAAAQEKEEDYSSTSGNTDSGLEKTIVYEGQLLQEDSGEEEHKRVEINIEEPSGTKVTVRTQEIKMFPDDNPVTINTKEVDVDALREIKEGPKNVQVSVAVQANNGPASVEVLRMPDGLTRVKTVEENGNESENIFDGDANPVFTQSKSNQEQVFGQSPEQTRVPIEETGETPAIDEETGLFILNSEKQDPGDFYPTGPIGMTEMSLEDLLQESFGDQPPESMGLSEAEADENIEKIFQPEFPQTEETPEKVDGAEVSDRTEAPETPKAAGDTDSEKKTGFILACKIIAVLLVIVLVVEMCLILTKCRSENIDGSSQARQSTGEVAEQASNAAEGQAAEQAPNAAEGQAAEQAPNAAEGQAAEQAPNAAEGQAAEQAPAE